MKPPSPGQTVTFKGKLYILISCTLGGKCKLKAKLPGKGKRFVTDVDVNELKYDEYTMLPEHIIIKSEDGPKRVLVTDYVCAKAKDLKENFSSVTISAVRAALLNVLNGRTATTIDFFIEPDIYKPGEIIPR